MTTSDPNTRVQGSTEYVKATVVADVDLDTQTVAISVGTPTTWLPATWDGDTWTSIDPATQETRYHRVCRTTNPVTFTPEDFPPGQHTVDVKVTDNPEAPILRAGWIAVTT